MSAFPRQRRYKVIVSRPGERVSPCPDWAKTRGVIHGRCPQKDCPGTIAYESVPNLPGMTGQCDTCGAQYRLTQGQTIMTSPPTPLDKQR